MLAGALAVSAALGGAWWAVPRVASQAADLGIEAAAAPAPAAAATPPAPVRVALAEPGGPSPAPLPAPGMPGASGPAPAGSAAPAGAVAETAQAELEGTRSLLVPLRPARKGGTAARVEVESVGPPTASEKAEQARAIGKLARSLVEEDGAGSYESREAIERLAASAETGAQALAKKEKRLGRLSDDDARRLAEQAKRAVYDARERADAAGLAGASGGSSGMLVKAPGAGGSGMLVTPEDTAAPERPLKGGDGSSGGTVVGHR